MQCNYNYTCVVSFVHVFNSSSLSLLPTKSFQCMLSVTAGAYKHYADDFELRQNYSLKNAADAAGFYTDCAFDSLARENPTVTFIHAAPGFVKTSWGTEMPVALRGLIRCLQWFATPARDCAEVLVDVLIKPREGGGFLPIGAKGDPAGVTKQHEAAREAVWQKTKELLARVAPA